jgi:hypothetical protein
LAIRSIINAGATGVMAWNEGDGWWGKLNNDLNWTMRPAAYLYKMLNEHAVGSVVASSSSNNSLVEILAIRNNESAKKAFVLINRSQADQTVQMSYLNWDIQPSSSTPVSVYQAGSNGYTTKISSHSVLLAVRDIYCLLILLQYLSIPTDSQTFVSSKNNQVCFT